jgi:hypothetical protein
VGTIYTGDVTIFHKTAGAMRKTRGFPGFSSDQRLSQNFSFWESNPEFRGKSGL